MDASLSTPLLTAETGTVCGFRTSPLFKDSAPDTGRYGAFIVLGTSAEMAVIGVLPGVWESMPELAEITTGQLLRRNRFGFRNEVAVFACTPDSPQPWAECAVLGVVALTSKQQAVAKKYLSGKIVGLSFSSLSGVNNDVEGEWRWEYDQAAMVYELDLSKQDTERARAALQQRYESRLKTITLEQLVDETPLTHWTPSPPYPSEEFRTALVARIHQTCRELHALGDHPPKAEAFSVLKDFVLWINEADDQADNVIETEEREDLLVVLEELCYAVAQPALFQEVGSRRSW